MKANRILIIRLSYHRLSSFESIQPHTPSIIISAYFIFICFAVSFFISFFGNVISSTPSLDLLRELNVSPRCWNMVQKVYVK